MAHFRTMFNSDYIGAWDLPKDRDVTVTIAQVNAANITGAGGKQDPKPVLFFEGKKKGLVCNKTICKVIAELYGPDTDDWVGKRIALYPTTTQFGRETVECIRVRERTPGPVGRPKGSGRQVQTTADGEVLDTQADTSQQPAEDHALFQVLLTAILDSRSPVSLNAALQRVDDAEERLLPEQLAKIMHAAKDVGKDLGVPNAG